MICAYTAIGAFGAIVANYSEVTVTYADGDSSTYDVNIHTGYSWSLMLVASLLSTGQLVVGIMSLFQAKAQLAEMNEPLAVSDRQKLDG